MRMQQDTNNHNTNIINNDILLNRIHQLEGQLGNIQLILGELVNQQNEVNSITKKIEAVALIDTPPSPPSSSIASNPVIEQSVATGEEVKVKDEEEIGQYYPASDLIVVGSQEQLEVSTTVSQKISSVKLTKEERIKLREQRKQIKLERIERKNLKRLDKSRIKVGRGKSEKIVSKDKSSLRHRSDITNIDVSSQPQSSPTPSGDVVESVIPDSSTSNKKKLAKDKMDKKEMKKEKKDNKDKLKDCKSKMNKEDKKKLRLEKRQERLNQIYSRYVAKMNKKNSKHQSLENGSPLTIMNMDEWLQARVIAKSTKLA